MDQDSTHMVAASKVPMLKPENRNAPPITKLVEGVETIIAPATAEGKRTTRRIQKLISQLEIHGENISQEDVNQKFLRSLSQEWNTHTIVWRNKPEINTLSLDNLYNNMKIYVPEVADGYAYNEGKERKVILVEHAMEVLAPWNQGKDNREYGETRRVMPVEITTSNALISYDGLGNFMPPEHDLSFSGLEEFVNEPIFSETTVKKPIVETNVAKASEANPKAVRKSNGAPVIEDWVSDSEEEDVPQAKIKKKIVKSSFAKIEFVKSKEQVKYPRKTVNLVNQNRQNTHTPRGNKKN
ncbi:hypothetical protein Tco_0039505 [Tanacetum coccineum]